MDYKLIVIAGDAKQKVVKIKPPTIIGRSRDVDLPVGHPLVSRKHCEITVSEEGTLIVEDLGSLNGTYHGDQRITEPVYLEPGDTLTVGSITFQAVYGDFQPEQDAGLMPPATDEAADAEDEVPDFLSAEEEDVEEVDVEEASDDDAFPDFEAATPKQELTEQAEKKRRPPPPVMQPSDEGDEEDDIAGMLDLPEEEDEEEEIVDVDETDDFDDDEPAAKESTSDISVGEEDGADIEEEVEVAASDSRSGDSSAGESGSGLGWLTGDEDDSDSSGDSGLDDFFKSL